jgi:hypothetical protein
MSLLQPCGILISCGLLSRKYHRGVPRPKGVRLNDANPCLDEQKAYDVKKEIEKQAEHSRLSIWLMVFAFGASITSLGTSTYIQATATPAVKLGDGIFIMALGWDLSFGPFACLLIE